MVKIMWIQLYRLPQYALEKDDEIRFSELEETIKIMDAFPYTYEED